MFRARVPRGEQAAAAAHGPAPSAQFVYTVRNFLARALNESGRSDEAQELIWATLELLGPRRRTTLISMVTLGEILLGGDGVTPDPSAWSVRARFSSAPSTAAGACSAMTTRAP
jgi:hypothetical protein